MRCATIGDAQRVGDRRAVGDVERDNELATRSGIGDVDAHRRRVNLSTYTASARRTNASMNVFAIWPNTGPIALSSSGVANS